MNDAVDEANTADILVIGAGAAGLATAIFAARAAPRARVRCLDGATHIGAKILVSGGSRCNVTNRLVTERDFWGGSPRAIRSVLRAFPAERAREWFADLGVALHEEEDGKLFPNTNRSRTVLDALLADIARRGVALETGQRVSEIDRDGDGFVVSTDTGRRIVARAVVLACGGLSLPKTGSNGGGYRLARHLGHGHVRTTPALAPLVFGGESLARLSGIAHDTRLTLRADGRQPLRLDGALLWTHFGASGPVVLNMSRHWHRARLDAGDPESVDVSVSVCPGETIDSIDRWLLEQASLRPRARMVTVLATRVPAAVAEEWVAAAGIDGAMTLSHLERDTRRRLATLLVDLPLRVRDSRGFTYAEVTAGGVPLDEIDSATMESRICPGLYLVGEILDVDGRLGGFNFQWAWSSAAVAGRAIGAVLQR